MESIPDLLLKRLQEVLPELVTEAKAAKEDCQVRR